MDAPKGRYSVLERDGRLIVIDNLSGAPIPSTPVSPPRPGSAGAPAPIVAGKGMFDRFADHLLKLAVRQWDGEGRAVIAWEWKENGKTKRWDALLDRRQQRRLGRALAGLCAAPLLVLLFIFVDIDFAWLAAVPAVLPVLWSVRTITRLQSETSGQPGPRG